MLLGHGFGHLAASPTAVMVGGKACPVLSWSNDTVVCSAPSLFEDGSAPSDSQVGAMMMADVSQTVEVTLMRIDLIADE